MHPLVRVYYMAFWSLAVLSVSTMDNALHVHFSALKIRGRRKSMTEETRDQVAAGSILVVGGGIHGVHVAVRLMEGNRKGEKKITPMLLVM